MHDTDAQREPLVLVVPCYNEAARLNRAAFEAALSSMPWLQLCFVNDGSRDDTGTLLESIRQAWPDRVRVVSLAKNAGKAEAVRQGLLMASTISTTCGFWDADLATPLHELVALREVLSRHPQVEWVWGIRLRALGRQVERRALRHYLGRLFATCSSVLLGIDSYDTQCGAKLFTVSPLLRAVIAEPFRSRWIFDVEMLARADALLRYAGTRRIGTVVYEQPLALWQHVAGSKVKPVDFVKAFRELLVVRSQQAVWCRALPARPA